MKMRNILVRILGWGYTKSQKISAGVGRRGNPLHSFLSQSEMMCRFKSISLNLLREIQNRLVLEKKLFINYLLKQLLYSFIDRCFVGIDPNGI